MVLVSADDLLNKVQEMIRERASTGPVGLYAERELRELERTDPPLGLFSQPKQRPRRAIGAGPTPIADGTTNVGSEGIIAQAISQLCLLDPKRFLNHPGPDLIRSEKVKQLLIVTDFVGSGDRVLKYLNALWRVCSVRSWWSLRRVSLGVFCYAATPAGRKRAARHSAGPVFEMVRSCPTIVTEFGPEQRARVLDLCRKYDPLAKKDGNYLGHGRVGALLAFAHGVPNNVPRLLFKKGSRPKWVPLFAARVTLGAREVFRDELNAASISRRLQALNQYRLSVSPELAKASARGQRLLLVLASLARGPRTEETTASRTGLTVSEVRDLIREARINQFVTDELFVTDSGHRELKHYRKARDENKVPLQENRELYYPVSLRPPRTKSS